MTRRIVAAALRRPDGYLYILQPPNRHHDIIAHMRGCCLSVKEITACTQGFVDGAGTFLDRKAAWPVADSAGQITRLPGGVDGLLFSENLW